MLFWLVFLLLSWIAGWLVWLLGGPYDCLVGWSICRWVVWSAGWSQSVSQSVDCQSACWMVGLVCQSVRQFVTFSRSDRQLAGQLFNQLVRWSGWFFVGQWVSQPVVQFVVQFVIQGFGWVVGRSVSRGAGCSVSWLERVGFCSVRQLISSQ